jgi:hypothetical protein
MALPSAPHTLSTEMEFFVSTVSTTSPLVDPLTKFCVLLRLSTSLTHTEKFALLDGNQVKQQWFQTTRHQSSKTSGLTSTQKTERSEHAKAANQRVKIIFIE